MTQSPPERTPPSPPTGLGHAPGPLAVLAIAVMSVLGLMGGGLVGAVIRGDQGTASGEVSPTPAPDLSSTEPDLTTPQPGVAEEAPSQDPEAADEGPRIFRDGFTLQTQPCASEPTGPDCDASGVVNDGVVWVLLSFENGEPSDVLGVTVVTRGDEPVGGGDVALADIGCSAECDGWTYFDLSGLEPGAYRVNVSRNGAPAGSTAFETER